MITIEWLRSCSKTLPAAVNLCASSVRKGELSDDDMLKFIEKGYYVKPTVFADVTNDMTIAQEEIFGPVLCMMKYETEEEAIQIANDTEYGLAGYVQGELSHAIEVGNQIRAGQITINGGARGNAAPFGGYKSSGNGREHGKHGIEECLETKAIIAPAS